jgi:hypothetical protein
MFEGSFGELLHAIGSTVWAMVLAFLTLAFPAKATIGGEPALLWIWVGCAVALGLGFGLRHRLRAWIRHGIALWRDRDEREPVATCVVMVLAEPPPR